MVNLLTAVFFRIATRRDAHLHASVLLKALILICPQLVIFVRRILVFSESVQPVTCVVWIFRGFYSVKFFIVAFWK
jgi:uncharacterized membrane protein YozB (DUF420 family)